MGRINLLISTNPIKTAYHGIKYTINKKEYYKRRIEESEMLLKKDEGLNRGLAIIGNREKETTYIIEKEIKPNDNVIDAGANIGYHTLKISRLTKGKIYAIEPNKENYKQLKKNIKLNGAKIIASRTALSDKTGKAELHISEYSNIHTLEPRNTEKLTGEKITVKTKALHEILKKERIHLIKMDIEGHETKVLKSLNKAKQMPTTIIELHPKKYTKKENPKKQIKKLMEKGYYCAWLGTKKKLKGLKPSIIINTDGTKRRLYENVPYKKIEENLMDIRLITLKEKTK